MTYQQAIVPMIEDAMKTLFANGEALSDKLDFKASETTRTPLQLLVECTTAPAMLKKVIEEGGMDPNAAWEEQDFSPLSDVNACRAFWESNKEEVFAAVRNFPDEKLQEPIATPWGTFPWYDFIGYLYWNPMWHAGQLSYIQTIHGDTEMHG